MQVGEIRHKGVMLKIFIHHIWLYNTTKIIMEQKKQKIKIQWQCNVNTSVTSVYYSLITRRSQRNKACA